MKFNTLTKSLTLNSAIAAVVLTCMLTTSHAQQAVRKSAVATATQPSDINGLRARLLQNYPDTIINEISPAPIAGLYEIVMGRNLAYTDITGRYILFGTLLDSKEKVNLTTKRQSTSAKSELANLPLDKSIKIKQGDGSRKLIVFSDAECPFCRQIEPELEKIANVTLHYFLMPMSTGSSEKAQSVWCAKDRGAAWKQAIGGKAVASARCQTPFDEIAALARRIGANGTPTMFTEDGRILQGFTAAADIEQFMSKTQ